MICFGNGTANWEAIGAIATAVATIVALWSSWNAIRMPQRAEERARREATREIILASEEAVAIFEVSKGALAFPIAPPDALDTAAARADHICQTLDRLLNRTSLTDGAIATGAGAMRLMDAVVNAQALHRKNPNSVYPERELARADPVAVVVAERMAKVRAHHGLPVGTAKPIIETPSGH
jgi:hypothetical protein